MMTILIFDSGVGGLSISQSLTDELPFAEQILLADNRCFPYGEMDSELLVNRVSDLLVKAVTEFKPDCIVIACNTVSTVALEKIRNVLSIPVIGVVPAIKSAATLSSSKVIALLATPATVARSYTADLINTFANDCMVISIGNTRLVEIAELRLRGIEVDAEEVKNILKPLLQAEKEHQLDVVVLGCTHFPLLSDILNHLLPESITLVDSSKAIARQVKKVMEDGSTGQSSLLDQVNEQRILTKHRCFMTQLKDDQLTIGLQRFGFDSPELFIQCSG